MSRTWKDMRWEYRRRRDPRVRNQRQAAKLANNVIVVNFRVRVRLNREESRRFLGGDAA